MRNMIGSTIINYVDSFIVFSEIPDEISLAFTISNCPNNCCGCHSPELRTNIGHQLTTQVILDKLLHAKYTTCVLFMGGDANPDYIDYLAQNIKENTSLKTAVYSGLVNPTLFQSLFFDYIKTGPYIPSRGPLTKKTTNQQLFKANNNKWIDITYRMFI